MEWKWTEWNELPKKESQPYTVMWWVFGRFTKRPCWFSFSTGWTTCTAQRRGSLADSTWPPPFRAHRFFPDGFLSSVPPSLTSWRFCFPRKRRPSLFSPDNNHPRGIKLSSVLNWKNKFFFFRWKSTWLASCHNSRFAYQIEIRRIQLSLRSPKITASSGGAKKRLYWLREASIVLGETRRILVRLSSFQIDAICWAKSCRRCKKVFFFFFFLCQW